MLEVCGGQSVLFAAPLCMCCGCKSAGVVVQILGSVTSFATGLCLLPHAMVFSILYLGNHTNPDGFISLEKVYGATGAGLHSLGNELTAARRCACAALAFSVIATALMSGIAAPCGPRRRLCAALLACTALAVAVACTSGVLALSRQYATSVVDTLTQLEHSDPSTWTAVPYTTAQAGSGSSYLDGYGLFVVALALNCLEMIAAMCLAWLFKAQTKA
jgi:hypothetical protein